MAEKAKRAPKVKLNVGEFPTVDIMPVSRRNTIELKLARAKWTKNLITAVAVGVVLSTAAFGFRVYNQLQYDAAVSEQELVESQINTEANVDIDHALTLRETLKVNVQTGGLTAIKWQDLESRITNQLPNNVTITALSISTGGIDEGAPAATMLMSITSPQPITYSTTFDAFNNIDGIVEGTVKIGNLTGTAGSTEGEGSSYTYPVAFSIDTSVLANPLEAVEGETAPLEAPPLQIGN
jgi:hypothetical protein